MGSRRKSAILHGSQVNQQLELRRAMQSSTEPNGRRRGSTSSIAPGGAGGGRTGWVSVEGVPRPHVASALTFFIFMPRPSPTRLAILNIFLQGPFLRGRQLVKKLGKCCEGAICEGASAVDGQSVEVQSAEVQVLMGVHVLFSASDGQCNLWRRKCCGGAI